MTMPPQHWIKSVYNSPGRKAASDWQTLTWVSDGPPGQRPQYRIGDELLIYCVPCKSFPARARVTSEAYEDRGLVDRDGGPGEGETWPYVTTVKVLGAVDISRAPTPRQLKVTITQGGRKRIDAAIYRRAVAAIPAGYRHPPLREPLARPIPIEAATEEPYEQRFEAASRAAYRREQILLKRFERHLRRRGHDVTRYAITLPGGTEIRSDLNDLDTGLLVEAKATIDRSAIRMAIGQLADYARCIEPRPRLRAVLVPGRPPKDVVALLDSVDIGVIWLSGGRFRDNRGGRLIAAAHRLTPAEPGVRRFE